MVRHGEAAAGYAEHPDPGLSERGRSQAAAVAATLAELGPLLIVSSPMARARQTALPLAGRWATEAVIEEAFSEIPSPGLSPAERGPWLSQLTDGTWSEAGTGVQVWRDGIEAGLLALERDAVVFSHFVAINAAISVAIDSDTPRSRHLDHCSVTTFETDGERLRLLETGDEAKTVVL